MSKDTHFGSKKQYIDVNIQQGTSIKTKPYSNTFLSVKLL
jgi:hypothetical protein